MVYRGSCKGILIYFFKEYMKKTPKKLARKTGLVINEVGTSSQGSKKDFKKGHQNVSGIPNIMLNLKSEKRRASTTFHSCRLSPDFMTYQMKCNHRRTEGFWRID